ncbi:MAG: GWxTD domain-containing protein [Acidobacteria bacterium]|nr:MAG: GWxTD domain-containing protein [Acidobacteriota bacterium]
MSNRRSGRLAVALLTLIFAVPSGLAQKKNSEKTQDPSEKTRNVKPELNKAYKDWLEKDVAYIITDEERKAFKKLQTDDERERFIEEFWRRRDPDPDTDENEYREEYYERIAYANEHYASGIPGWKTDRGRIYIMWGKPDETESHPSGGAYNRESYEGGGSTSTYPFERWFYRYLPGVGSGVEIEFVDPTGSGEYRIARNPDEKDALLHVPGAGLTLAEEMGLSNKGDRISNLGGVGMPNYQREQDSPFSRLQILADLQRPPQIKFNDLASAVNTPVIEDNPLNFDVRVDFFRQSDERVITAFTVQTDNQNLVFKDSGGLQEATLNIFGKITHVSGRRAGVFEDPVTTRATPEELTEAKERKSAYQKAVALAPGTYRVDVIVRDVASGATGVRHVGFVVPKYDTAKLSTSTLVLAAKLEGLGDQPAVGMFTIGNVKVIPNVSGTYHKGTPVGIYMQIYNAGIDQTTLRPSVGVEYALMKDGKEIFKAPEDWRGNSDAGQRLTLARLLDSRSLNPGDYSIEVRVRDRVSGQSLVQTAKFTVLP